MVEITLVKLDEKMSIPSYAHPGDAGLDLRSAVNTLIKSGDAALIPTGIKIAIPSGYVGLVWDKSGYAAKNSIHTLAGVVDSGYRGEIRIVLKNFGNDDFNVTKDMKVAQLLIQPIVTANIVEVDSLEETSRAEGGFGSTGVT